MNEFQEEAGEESVKVGQTRGSRRRVRRRLTWDLAIVGWGGEQSRRMGNITGYSSELGTVTGEGKQ